MNDNDLEQQLRTQTGPREGGYVPSQLPATLDSGPDRRPSRALHLAVLVPAVVAGVAVVAVAAALLTGGGPGGVGSGSSPTQPASSTPPEVTHCQPADVAFEAEAWGGAAGSRGTVVTVRLADGRYPCLFSPVPGARIEAQGATLVESAAAGADAMYTLETGMQARFSVTWSNWCGKAFDSVNLVVVSGGVDHPVEVPPGIGAMPPCMGENTPSTLSVTDLSSAP
ncbi:MAG TPA: DUF4232 domain-containing protein [Candidatus Limnocylindria bacterium]